MKALIAWCTIVVSGLQVIYLYHLYETNGFGKTCEAFVLKLGPLLGL